MKRLLLSVVMLATFNASATDTVVNTGIWSAEYNSGSSFYSTQSAGQEITMECFLGEFKFGLFDKPTESELNSNDSPVAIYIDGIKYRQPKTPVENEALYHAIERATYGIQYVFADGFKSKLYPVEGLGVLFKDSSYQDSNCAE
ncbi:hypothetical protein [Proteus phage 10]|nr:hypothetical protein [Proteus phage 10]